MKSKLLQKPLLVWDANAERRHEEWAFSIGIEYGIQQMDSYLDSIDQAVTSLQAHPSLGTDASWSGKKNLRRLVTSQGYSIFYELDSLENPAKVKIISIVRGQEG